MKNTELAEMNNEVLNENVFTRHITVLSKGKTYTRNSNQIYLKVKRGIDIILSGLAIYLLSPFFIIISLAVRLDSKGAAIFRQKRIGKNGKIIEIYKFRTMIENAEDAIKNFNKEQLKEFKENYKLNDDPRITRVGRFLRKTSLDELPQIVNILMGELSIIGPRPVITEELEKYGKNKEKFLSITPGLTGYWQANGRSCTTYEERMEMELYYIDNISLLLDIKIFFKTIITVVLGKGAV